MVIYRTENRFGHGQVDEAEARRVFETWPRGTSAGDLVGTLEAGFTAYVASGLGGQPLSTTYTPDSTTDEDDDA